VIVTTPRLVLRPFTDMDRAPFHELNTHPLVVESLGQSPTREKSDLLVDAINEEMEAEDFGLWALEVVDGPRFAGMVGLHRVHPDLPVAPAVEVAWRLHPDLWGHGYASEAALASLRHGFDPVGLREIVALTTTRNARSQAVMARIGMRRDLDGDFDHPSLPEGSPLRRHVLYRIQPSPLPPTVAA
jgi:RimJ/RimL family protein N-acetyltransferase